MKENEDIRGMQVTIMVYALILAMKLVVYMLTGVMALLAEALHTLSDIFISGFLLAAAFYSRKRADEMHMFGYGRAQNVAALVAATMFISFTSFELYKEAIPSIIRPPETEYKNLTLALAVLVVSMVIAAAPLVKLLQQEKRGAAAKAQLIELLNDELGLLAALVGTLFIIWDKPIADPIATIVVATIIAINAIGLFRENLSYLLGRSPGREYLANIERIARSVEGVVGVHDLRAEYIGPDTVHAGLHIEVPSGISIDEANRIVEAVDKKIHKEIPSGYCIIHADAAKSVAAMMSETA